MNNRLLGSKYEQIAADYLESTGMTILERNFRTRDGEIDIIAKDGRYLVFVEVKYRTTAKSGYALEAINKKKQSQLKKLALIFVKSRYPGRYVPMRFDCIGITGEKLRHIRNAF